MATYTDNYHLEKPAQSDLYNVDVFNDNADLIDAALDDLDASKALAQNLAPIESSSAASRSYAVGEYLVYNGLLYKVTSAIASGGTISPGSNCTATNAGAQLKTLNDSLTKSNLSSLVEVHFDKVYGADVPINIDTIANDLGYIYRVRTDTSGFSGTSPSSVLGGGNAFLIMGFSSYYGGALHFGVQIAIGFTAAKIGMRYLQYTSAGGNWSAWTAIS